MNTGAVRQLRFSEARIDIPPYNEDLHMAGEAASATRLKTRIAITSKHGYAMPRIIRCPA